MKIEKLDGSNERRILTAMIVKTDVLGKISKFWKGRMFTSKWADIVGGWCVEYYSKYGKAPRRSVEGLFMSWAKENATRPDAVKMIEKFLEALSGEYASSKKINSAYVIDLAAEHFTKVRLERLLAEVQGEVDRGRIKAATKRWGEFERVDMGLGSSVSVLENEDAIKEALEETTDSLIEYPGALGRFFQDQLIRDSFICLFAPEKRGKTFWLIDFAFMGVEQGYNVAFFSAGDLSQNQMYRRLVQRWSDRPLKAKTIKIPKKIHKGPDGELTVTFEEKTWNTPLAWQSAVKNLEGYTRTKVKGGGRPKKKRFKLSTHSNSSLSVQDIRDQLDTWKREEDWVPDVVVVDYWDILRMEGDDERDRVNRSWKEGRKLSQDYHVLLITASQTNAAGGEADVLTRSHFSEDKRKLAHVTGILGINEKRGDKKLGIQRLNWIVLREAEYVVEDMIAVAGCRGLTRPWMRVYDRLKEFRTQASTKKSKKTS